MKKIFEEIVCLVAMATVAYSCSVPEGGFKEPTPAEIVQYSNNVVVGEVTEIIELDPLFGKMYGNSTYGAMITVQCAYKGGTLPGRIQIGAAGFVPGMCNAMPLEKGTHYVLFLREKDSVKDLYQQSEAAALKTKLGDFLGVCGLSMQYPMEQGMMLKRQVCPPATQLDSCQTADKTTPKLQDVTTSKSAPDQSGDDNAASMVTSTSVSAILFSYLCFMML